MAEEPSASPAANVRDHAIVVGINSYAEPCWQLEGAVKDAELFSAWLKDPRGGGLPDANVHLICSPTPFDAANPRPIRKQIEDVALGYLQTWITTGQRVGRRLYLFFAGHGVTPAMSASEETALVMADALNIAIRALPGRLMFNILRKSPMFEEVVMFMDCCRSVTGSVMTSLDLPMHEDPSVPPSNWMCGLATTWAQATSERTLPHPLERDAPTVKHGVFTHALLTGLRVGYDDRGDVTADSLKRHVRAAVQQLVGTTDAKPVIEFPDDQPILFRSGAKDLLATVIRPADLSAGFRIFDGEFRAEISVEQAPMKDGASRVHLRPGRYVFTGPQGKSDPLKKPANILLEGQHVDV